MWINCTLLASFPSSKTNCQLLVKKHLDSLMKKVTKKNGKRRHIFYLKRLEFAKMPLLMACWRHNGHVWQSLSPYFHFFQKIKNKNQLYFKTINKQFSSIFLSQKI